MKQNKAFSLIELSIVILIIGIIIAGVTQGSRLITQMKLSTARTLTQSSPVAGIKGLSLWLETTTEASFDDVSEENGQAVTNWYDINPQSTRKFTATQATSNRQPTYANSVINGLPVLKFDGSNDSLAIPYDTALNSNGVTVLVVVQVTTAVDYDYGTIYASYAESPILVGYALRIDPSNTWMALYGANTYNLGLPDSGGITLGKPSVITSTIDSSGAKLFRDGSQKNGYDDVADYVGNTSAPFSIGTGSLGYLNGYVAEIIVFDRVLRNEERRDVEAYLGKKWGIKVS